MAGKKKTFKVVEPVRRKIIRMKVPAKSATGTASVPAAPSAPKPFPIVGLGASAGGLEALEKFFAHVPPDCGLAFVVVTHLHPGHISLLPELLGKCTQLRVVATTDGMVVEPNTVYMSLPNGYLAMLHGRLHLMKPDESGLLRLPIDYFFRSLAEDRKELAVGIVLSGTGTDGTLGLKAIKGAAGMTMAQEPDSAKYSGMPSSAIATGLMDYILPVERLPQQLVACTQGPYLATTGHEPDGEEALSKPMQKILVLLRARAGHDFSTYKINTIRRRIERRINVHQLQGPLQYLPFLSKNPHELDLLFKELLIGVTNFFRDAAAFGVLEKSVVPKLLAAQAENNPVRIWVAGCSTGEEAYSLAILLQEGMDKRKKHFPVQIFATDLDSEAINNARAGRYPEGIARDVHPQRLARFFNKVDGGYRIKTEIREMVIFAPQNVLKDPPFTKLDLVTCRNLLIYFKTAAQERLLALFHYALKPGGILFLGSSESLTGLSDHFTVMNKKWKIFARKDAVTVQTLPAEFTPTPAKAKADSGGTTDIVERSHKPLLSTMLEKSLLARFAPASVIVNDRSDILYIHGRTGDYLEPATGSPRLNILEMAREGLRLELSSALRRAATQKGEVVHENVRVKTNGHYSSVRLTVIQLTDPESVRGLLLVTFEIEAAAKLPVRARTTSRGTKVSSLPGRVPELERALKFTKESLQSTVEALQTSNEELKSSNEELQSTNEELQSTNEEMETSKEELQSLNEELQTVNAQLQGKLEDLAQANDDIQNLLNSTNIATIFLDQKLNIKRFTAEATKLVKLIPSDIGRPIGDLASNLHYDGLAIDAAEVLRKLGSKEKDVLTRDGEWRQVRIQPYRTTENVIDGLCITFININRLKSVAENIVATIREPLIVLDEKLCVASANPAFYRKFKTSAREVESRLIYQLGNGQWNIPMLRKLLEEILPRDGVFEDFKMEHNFPGLGHRKMLLNARRLKQAPDVPGMILLAFEDVTPENAAEKHPRGGRKGSAT